MFLIVSSDSVNLCILHDIRYNIKPNAHVGMHYCHKNTAHIAMYSNLPVHDTILHYTLHYNMKAIRVYHSVLDLTPLEMDKVRYCNHITKYSREVL
jgi:hypothetical protein